MSIRIVLADDHKMILAALRSLLEKEIDIAVVGEAGDGTALLELVERTAPDVVVVDVGMPGMNGIEATRRLLAVRPLLKVIALSAYSDKRFVLEMLEAGAKGYLIKASAGDELPRAIRAIAQGQTYLCPEVAGAIVDAARGRTSGAGNAAAKLGRREREAIRRRAAPSTRQTEMVQARRRTYWKMVHEMSAASPFQQCVRSDP